LGSLISHARLSLALPIALLAVAVRGSSSLAPLVPSVGCAPLLASNDITARRTAVPLSPVAMSTDRKHRPALWRPADSHAENGRGLVDHVAHSVIMREQEPFWDGSGRRTFFGSRRRSPEFGSPRSDSAQSNPRRGWAACLALDELGAIAEQSQSREVRIENSAAKAGTVGGQSAVTRVVSI